MDDHTPRFRIVPESFDDTLSQIENTPKKENVPKKERGGCLTGYLLYASLMILPGILSLYSFYFLFVAFIANPSLEVIINNNLLFFNIGSILYCIGLIGAWRWKKWGIILMEAVAILLAFLTIYTINRNMISDPQLFGFFVANSVIPFFVVRNKWKDFH